MSHRIDERSLDQLFRSARTTNGWSDKPVEEAVLRELYDLVKMGPTSANSTPARFVFVRSEEGRRKLSALCMGMNQAKVLAAPVTVIIGSDFDFADHMPTLFPERGEQLKAMFKDTPLTEPTARRNAAMQGAYLILAARALGLDTGPMSGFDPAGVDAAFFAGTQIKSNFICSLGYSNGEGVFPRLPRLSFEAACRFE